MDVLDNAKTGGKSLCQSKNNYETGGILFGLFLAPKIKYCLTINEFRIVQERETFKGFIDSKRVSDRSQYFKMIESKKMSTMLP